MGKHGKDHKQRVSERNQRVNAAIQSGISQANEVLQDYGKISSTLASKRLPGNKVSPVRRKFERDVPVEMRKGIERFVAQGKEVSVDSLLAEAKSTPGFLASCAAIGLTLPWFEEQARIAITNYEETHGKLVKIDSFEIATEVVASAVETVTGVSVTTRPENNQRPFWEKLSSFFIIGKNEKKTAVVLAIGLVCSFIWQTYSMDDTHPSSWGLFLPTLGASITLLVPILYLLNRSERKEKIELGDKWIWIPLAVIVGIGVVRIPYVWLTGDTIWGLGKEVALAGYLVALFVLFVASRYIGSKVFAVMPYLVSIVCAGNVLFCLLIRPGIRTGGILSVSNYDIVAVFIVFGTLVSPLRTRWWLSAVAMVGLFFSGAEIGWVAVLAILLVAICRRDYGIRLLAPVVTLIALVGIFSLNGMTQKLYDPTVRRVEAFAKSLLTTNTTQRDLLLDEATNTRWLNFWELSPIKPLGYGYNINYFYGANTSSRGDMAESMDKAGVVGGIPHNIVLIIIEQLGPIALIAYFVVVGRLIRKSGWVYAWIGFLALGIFDHELWTLAAPLYWVLAGTSATNPVSKDYIFRR